MGLRRVKYDETYLVRHVSELISEISGNILGEKQKTMVLSRLKKRMLDLHIKSYEEYLNYLNDNRNDEVSYLVSLMTTHHTFFFREFFHFQYLEANLSDVISRVKASGRKKIKILSLGCSRGHEVYSLATFLNHQLSKISADVDFEILGTDIDSESVTYASNGVYRYNEVSTISLKYLSGNWSRGKGKIADFAKVKNHISEKCSFREGNLLNFNKEHLGEKFDIVFCRNVFIYFDKKDVLDVSANVLDHIEDGGLFFTGVSESLNGLGLSLKTLGASIYQKPLRGTEKVIEKMESIVEKIISPLVKLPKKLKVLCVDDSPTVIKMLTKIFQSGDDFEVVGFATNGIEAEKFLKQNPGLVDVITLDIHMPEMNGIEYMKRNFNKNHPATVIVSSASRDDATHSLEILKAGGSDFVEKPALNNLKEIAEELKNKLKIAYLDRASNQEVKIDSSFSSKEHAIIDPNNKVIILSASMVHKNALISYFEQCSAIKGSYPPIIILTNGNNDILPTFKKLLNMDIPRWDFNLLEDVDSIKAHKVYLHDFKTSAVDFQEMIKGRDIALGVFGNTTDQLQDYLIGFENSFLAVEDLGENSCSLAEVASDTTPITSFPYLFNEYFAKKDSK